MKGFDVALAALARLLPRFPDLVLSIAGDGPERAALEAQAARAGVGENVVFLGWQSPQELASRMRAASVVLVPSRADGTAYTEALTLVALEAAAVGRAVVASRVGGLGEAIVDGVTGLLVAPDDDEALARATATLLADPARAAAMGCAGHARALRELGWDATLASFQELFLRLAREGVAQNARTGS
jgi:glycosyltransferase involved in cell wall biosynthesis